MPRFCASIELEYPKSEVFQYHAESGAIDRLVPPWENLSVEARSDSLAVGSEVAFVNRVLGLPLPLLARHTQLVPNESFEDTMVRGPFRRWVHRHLFESLAKDRSQLTDSIDYELPMGPLGSLANGWVHSKLEAMFRYRHRTTADDLLARSRFAPRIAALGHRPRVAVTGGTGLIGRRTIELASVMGWEVIRIVRPGAKASQHLFPRSVLTAQIESSSAQDRELLENLDAVIHLAGFGIADKRWSPKVKQLLRTSRVQATDSLVQSLQQWNAPPKALVSASGIGLFGDAGDRVCKEDSVGGTDFLSGLARDWEGAAMAYAGEERRVCIARFGVVLHPRAGALAKLLTPVRLGLGGRMGSGKQGWPWVHVDDAANILLHLAIQPSCSGPFHVVAPERVTNAEFTRTLASVLRRPAFLPVPSSILRLALGEMADPLLLASVHATTERLLSSGYGFRFPTLRSALSHLLGIEESNPA